MNQNAGIRNKLILWALCLCLALGAAFAAAEPAEYVAEVPTQAAETVTPAITDAQAAAGFITQVMTGRKLTPPKPRGTVSRDLLTGREALVYDLLKAKIQQAAAGQLDSTEFQIPLKDIYENTHYTAEQLGVDYIYDFDTGSWNDAAFDAFNALNAFDFELVNDSLLYDLPYDLYWYDKTAGSSYSGGGASSDGSTVYFSDYENGMLTFSYKVSSDYAVNHASGGYALDTSYGARAVTAAENARSVVDSNEDKTDLHKLQAYKKYICDHVDYNHDAVNNGAAYGDPWQLVNVFDGDDSTKVVCEGYSKAFQFLCDESSFSGTSVISVSGMMAGGTGEGPHMWNIVTMGGRHYMADITNSDAGTVGASGGLFLNGYTEKVSDQEYIYATAGGDITYTYDPEIIDLLGETGRLAVAADAEKPAISVSTDGYIGGDVTVTVSGVEPARRYMEFWWLDGPNGPEMGPWDSYMNDTETYLGLAFLEAGDYEVWLYEMQGQYPDPDTDPVVASAAFTLQSRDLPAASVTVSGSEIMVGENLTYTIPGADAVADHLWMTTSTGEELWGTNPPWTYCTQGNTDTLPTANAGILSGEVWGRFNGVWSPAVALEDIRIQAENGIYPISLEIPDPWTAGQTYALSWTPLEGVENQHITLQIQDLDEEEDDPVLFEASLESAGTFIIQGDLLSDSGHYWMYISAGGDTYEDNVRSVNLNLVTNPARPAAPSVTVDPEQPETAQPLWFVTAQPYDVIQATVWFRDDAGRWGEAGAWNERQVVDSESQYGDPGPHDPVSSLRCTCDLYAGAWKARITVRQDGLWSEPTYLFFEVDPSPKLGNVTLAETIGNIEFKAPFSVKINAVEHATRYWASLMLKTEESEDGSYVSDTVAEAEYEVTDETGDVITLNFTDWSEAATPGTYWMAIDASADGYETSEVYFWNLNVVESTEPAVYVPETVALGEGLTFNVRNIPEGNRYVEYILVGDGDGIMAEWNTVQAPGSEFTFRFPQQMLDAQSYTLTVSLNADEYGEDEESKIKFEKTITVTSAAEKTGASLEESSFTVGSSSVPILLDSEAEEVWIQYGPAQYDEFATTKATDPANPALSLSGMLGNPGEYRLRVSAVTDGVRHPYSDWLNFEVLSQTPTEPAVEVPETVALGEGLTVNVRNIPEGNRYVEYLLVGDGDGIMADWNTIQAPGSEYTIRFPQQMLDAQSYTLTVSLNADEYGEDEESKIIFEKTITVTSAAEKTGASLERNSFTAGSSSVPVLMDSAAEEVWIQYGPARFAELGTTEASDPANPALSLSGMLDDPGEYRLRVSAVTDGVRHPYSDWLYFEVHTLTAHAAVPANCEEEGTAAYWKCSECGKLFADENATTEITAPAVLPKTAHTLIAREAVPSTCDREGTAAYWECSVCEKMFADENGTTEINEPAALPTIAHTLFAHPEVPATGDADGTAAYWECSVCGRLFADEDGNTEISAPAVLPKNGPTLTFDRTNGQPGDTVYATITAPGATQIRVTGIWGQVECYELKDGQTAITVPVLLPFYDWKDENGNLRGRTFGASALVNGVWSGTTTQKLTTVERPDFGDTPFRIAPTTLAAGQDLVIEFLPVEGITSYYITNDAFIENLDAPGTLTIPASLFYQGGSFSFDCGAGDDYAGDLLIEFVKVTAEPYTEAEPLTVTADKTNVASGEKVTFSLGGKQATRIYVQSRSDTGTNYWYDYGRKSAPGDSAAGSFEIPIHGSAEYRISALVNGKWTDWSRPVAITATSGGSQGGELTNPDFTVEKAELEEGSVQTISWNAVEHAETYKVIWQGASSGSLETAETSVSIPAEKLTAGEYYVTVLAEAKNYWNESARVWKPFTVTEKPGPAGPTGSEPTLKLPAGLTAIEAEAFAGTAAEAVVIPETVTDIDPTAFDGSAVVYIYGKPGSAAEDFAREHDLFFVPMD